MEETLIIPTKDGKKIYGKARGPLKGSTIVFVHGLGGRMDQHIFFNGARFFEKHGFSSVRFDLYNWADDARKLDECTLATHAADLNTVIDYVRSNGADKIIVVGHSFGGPTILASQNKQYDVVILWDPSYGYPSSFQRSEYIESINMYKATWEFNVLIGKAMIDEAKTLTDKEERAIQELQKPVKIISAGKSHLVEGCKRYYELANDPKSYSMIENANHTFDEDGNEELLFAETLSFVNNQIKPT